jgi:L-ascorbate metabolism protein UlaG (beta-lactamase superfamily)
MSQEILHNAKSMTITKFGHCCVLLEVQGKRILIDPGNCSTEQNTCTDIDIILITHEHKDHCHTDSVALIARNNPRALVVTNTSVASVLEACGVSVRILEGRDTAEVCGISIAAFDGVHVEIFETVGLVQNTGYLVADEFFFAGDAYTVPEKTVGILALPVAGPWCKVSDTIRYALAVKPKKAFPVHDGTLNEFGRSVTYAHIQRELEKNGIICVIPTLGEAFEY